MSVRPDPTNPGGFVVDFRAKPVNGVSARQQERVKDRDAADLFLLEKARDGWPDLSDVKVKNFVEWWIEVQRRRGKITSTERANLEIRCLPTLGERRICDVTTEDLRLLRYSWNGTYKPSTCRGAATVIGRVFADAHGRGCRRDNPAPDANTDLPKRKQRRFTIYWPKPDEHAAIRRHATTAELVAIDLAAEMAIELPAQQHLKWGRDVDFQGRSIGLAKTTNHSTKKEQPFRMPGRTRRVPDMTDRLAATLLRARTLQVLDARRNGMAPTERVQPTLFGQRELGMTMTRLGLFRPDRETRRGAKTPEILRDKTVSGKWDQSTWGKYTASDICHIAVMRWIKQGLSAKVIATRLGYVTTKPVFAVYGGTLRARSKKAFGQKFEQRLAHLLKLSKG